jgi:hypothetical protein
MAKNTLERRVAALEAEIERLKDRVGAAPGPPWWEQIAGSFSGDTAFDQAMHLGREYRRSLRPKTPSTRKRSSRNGHPRH